MNVVQVEIEREALLPVTVSVPVYTENNEVIFETLRQSLAAVKRYRRVSGKEANIVVSDDGLAPLLGENCTRNKADALVRSLGNNPSSLTLKEKTAAQRIVFYRENDIAFVARPEKGRAGLFKKASNLNYTLRLGAAGPDRSCLDDLTQDKGAFAGAYAEGDIRTHEIILLLDKDSGVNERIMEAILPEFSTDEKLAYVQCASSAVNLNENYFTRAIGHQLNNLFHNIWPCKALQGYFVPLVGHNVFLRKSSLEKSGLWPENRVSEDYDKAICFYRMGFHGKYAQIKGLDFTEYVSRTFTEETGKQRRYSYGMFEMIFDGTVVLGQIRGCDFFYMLLYFFSIINQVLLLPTVLLESYFRNIHLLWAGFLFCNICFVFLPLFRSLVVDRQQPKSYSKKFASTLIVAFSFIGHSFSALAGACRYFSNKVIKNRKPFPSTNVDQLGYRFRDGLKLLAVYLKKNPCLMLLMFLCLDRSFYLLTRKGIETVTVFTYCYIFLGVVFAPVLLTPQLFSGFFRKRAAFKNAEGRRVNETGGKNNRFRQYPEMELPRWKAESRFLFAENAGFSRGENTSDRDARRFLEDYQMALQTFILDEDMPQALRDNYSFESCLKKDLSGKKALYLLRRREDNAQALLRVTKDYPEEDALEEAKLLARLDHPGVPKVFASFEQKGKNYIVREYIEGRSLDEIVRKGGCLSARDIFAIVQQLTDILVYLHSQKPPVIHRDIKPQNIIAAKDGSIHLIDFGIARIHKGERSRDTSVILTQDYASPEQYGFEQTTPLSDIYSLGMVMLFLSTGRTHRSGLEAQILNNQLRYLIEASIAFNPEARIQSVEEIQSFIRNTYDRQRVRRKQRRSAAAALLTTALSFSALSYALGFVAERNFSYRLAYERAYGVGYTEGFESSPLSAWKEKKIQKDGGNTAGNLAVHGGPFAVQSEDLIFYIVNGDIYRMSANTSETEPVEKDGGAAALSSYNDWLYYSSGGQILQRNIYTLERDVLCADPSGELVIAEQHFYVRADDALYLLEKETGKLRLLNRLPAYAALNIGGEHLFFINREDSLLYGCELGKDKLEKLTDQRCLSVCLYGDELYCSVSGRDGGEIVKINVKSREKEKLTEGKALMLNAVKNGIYYIDGTNGTINICSFDGRIRQRITRSRALDFNIAGGWIFYHNDGDDGRLWCVRLDGANDHPLLPEE